jgi:hypothetical protein
MAMWKPMEEYAPNTTKHKNQPQLAQTFEKRCLAAKRATGLILVLLR